MRAGSGTSCKVEVNLSWPIHVMTIVGAVRRHSMAPPSYAPTDFCHSNELQTYRNKRRRSHLHPLATLACRDAVVLPTQYFSRDCLLRICRWRRFHSRETSTEAPGFTTSSFVAGCPSSVTNFYSLTRACTGDNALAQPILFSFHRIAMPKPGCYY